MNRVIFHIDFNSYFATVEQQANPRLRGKPIGVTGGDRMERTVLGAVSVEAKAKGVKGGMTYADAKALCPDIILVRGDSDKYLECTKRFLNILKKFSPYIEIFSIDEVFLELPASSLQLTVEKNLFVKRNTSKALRSEPSGLRLRGHSDSRRSKTCFEDEASKELAARIPRSDSAELIVEALLRGSSFSNPQKLFTIGEQIKEQIRKKVGEWVRCSVGVSYNKRMAKFAGSLVKPDGLTIIADPSASMRLLDQVGLDEICGIGHRTKTRLHSMGITSFADLRKVPLVNLLASFKSYGKVLYDMARGLDGTRVVPFYEKGEVKSIGHRHTLSKDTGQEREIQQHFWKLSEMVARRLRGKNLVGKTIMVWYRAAFNRDYQDQTGQTFYGEGVQCTIIHSSDGLDIYRAAWKVFYKIWRGERIRMVGVSVSGLKSTKPENLSLLPEVNRTKVITSVLDRVNDRFGEFTLQRAVLLGSKNMKRMPNPFLSDRRFKL